MGNDKMNRLAEFMKGGYDSDEDLDEETQKKIKNADFKSDAEKIRNKGWDQAGPYPKLKRLVKGAWEEDIRAKKK